MKMKVQKTSKIIKPEMKLTNIIVKNKDDKVMKEIKED